MSDNNKIDSTLITQTDDTTGNNSGDDNNNDANQNQDQSSNASAADVLYADDNKGADNDKNSDDKNADNSDGKGAGEGDGDTDASAGDDKSDKSGDDAGNGDDDKDKGKSDKGDDKIELKLPDDSRVSKERADEIASYAKEQGLSNDAAQAMLDGEHKAALNWEQTRYGEFKELVKVWEEDTRNDAEIGGDNFDTTMANAKKVLTKFGNEKLTKTLNDFGLGSHPEIIRVLSKIGAAMGEDYVEGNRLATGKEPKSAASVLYPDNN